MKTALHRLSAPALVLGLALATNSAPARAMSISMSGDHVRWSRHHDPSDARLAITTEDGKVTLLLTDRDVAVQLSERQVHRVRRELRDKKEEQDNPLGMAIVAAVVGTVQELIDDSFACCVHDLRDVWYEDGRLRFTARNGEPVFGDVDLCDTDVMASFSERDAQRFVREFWKVKAGN